MRTVKGFSKTEMGLLNDHTNHPIASLSAFCARNPGITEPEFGLYKYHAQRLEDERELVYLRPETLIEEFSQRLKTLQPDQEIAFHSRVQVRVRSNIEVWHIPMIDFKKTIEDDDIEFLAQLASDFQCDEFDIFSSGRAHHFYGLTLISHLQWRKFMGRILLLNMPGQQELVDTRWVGHRLIGGYSALRWTHNTSHYKQVPRLERSWNGTEANLQNGHRSEIVGASLFSYEDCTSLDGSQ